MFVGPLGFGGFVVVADTAPEVAPTALGEDVFVIAGARVDRGAASVATVEDVDVGEDVDDGAVGIVLVVDGAVETTGGGVMDTDDSTRSGAASLDVPAQPSRTADAAARMTAVGLGEAICIRDIQVM